jgi:glycine/D-amino acid oxidase-like deaminating enzyme
LTAVADALHGPPRSLWLSINPDPPPATGLQGEQFTQVAVVGAGIAGLSVALHLGERGVETTVLEASPQQPNAATAASAGVVAPQLTRHSPEGVLKALGPEVGARYLALLAEAGVYTFGLIRAKAIACSAQPHGFINPVAGPGAVDAVGSLIRQWAPYRTDLVQIGAEETRRLTGCEGYAAALVDPTGGGLDPVAFVQGLEAALERDYVQVHRASAVRRLERTGEGWALRTASGTLFAKTVVCCANGGNPGLHRSLAKTVLPLSVYQVATAPLGEAARRGVLPFGHAMTDASGDVFSLRLDGDGRLITACSAATLLDPAELDQWVNRRLTASVPSYSQGPLEFIWKGTAWLNSNLLPRLVAVEEGLYAVQACNGRGLALNTVIGREVAALVAGDPVKPRVPVQRPRPVPGYVLARHAPGLLMAGTALLKRLRFAA